MAVRAERQSKLGRAGQAILAAAIGLLCGVVVHAFEATMRVLLDPGVAAGGGAGAWILGSLLVFAGALFWSLLGGVVLVLPLASIVFVVLASRVDWQAAGPGRRALLGAVLWSLLFGVLLAFRSGATVVDAGLLGIAVAVGVACGFGRLARMRPV